MESDGDGATAAEFTMDCAKPPHDREPVTTIAWRLSHLIDVFGPPTAPHFDGPAADHGVGYCGTAEGALRQLDEGHDAWIRDVRRLGAAGLARPQGTMSPPPYADAPIAKLILHIHREVIHHGAEISLLRDLYRWKDSGLAYDLHVAVYRRQYSFGTDFSRIRRT